MFKDLRRQASPAVYPAWNKEQPCVAAMARLVGLSRKSVYKALEPTRGVA